MVILALKTIEICGRRPGVLTAITVIGVVCAASALSSFNSVDRSTSNLTQEVNRAVKASLLAFPDVTLTVARDEKANSEYRPVASQVAFHPEAEGFDASAPSAAPVRKSDGTPSSIDDAAPAVAIANHIPSAPDVDNENVIIESAADTNETSTNVTEEPEGSNPPVGPAWSHSKEPMERAGHRARVLLGFSKR